MTDKNTLALEIAEDLRKLAARIEAYVKGQQEVEGTAKIEAVPNTKPKPITLEQVRALLAEKSQSGKQSEVKALIAKYGVKKLTDIDPAHYPELLKEAEAL